MPLLNYLHYGNALECWQVLGLAGRHGRQSNSALIDGLHRSRLLNELWCQRGHASRCIVLPGNHDLLLTAWKAVFWQRRLEDWNRVFDTSGFVGDAVPAGEAEAVTPATLEAYYAEREFRRAPSGSDRAQVEETARRRAREALRACEYFPRFQTAFLKINSHAARIWWPGDIATGCARIEQLSRLASMLKGHAEAFASAAESGGFQEARLIGALHHHVTHLRFSLTAVGSDCFEDFALQASGLKRGLPLARIEVTNGAGGRRRRVCGEFARSRGESGRGADVCGSGVHLASGGPAGGVASGLFSRYRLSRVGFAGPDEIAHVRVVYEEQLAGVAPRKLEEFPLFEHLLVAER